MCLFAISCASVQSKDAERASRDIYRAGAALVPFEADMKVKKANALKAVLYFKEVIEKYPNTDHADLSYVQLGLCYEYLEQWEDAEKAYENLIQKYTDEMGNPITPFSENIKQALQFARDRVGKLRMLHKLIAFNFAQVWEIPHR